MTCPSASCSPRVLIAAGGGRVARRVAAALYAAGEAVADQVSVVVQGEGGGVVAHPALQAQWTGALIDEKGSAGVAQGVEARPRDSGALRCGDHHAVAHVAGAQRGAVGADE